MGNYKFDKFYYSEDQSNEHYLSEIENLSDKEYNNTYKDKMYCPWCKGPQLSRVVKDGSVFLRTYRGQTHKIIDEKICPYEYDAATTRTVENYVNELRSKKKIKSLLESIMRMMFRKSYPKNTTPGNTNNDDDNPLLIKRFKNEKTTTRNIIPHYNFKNWGKNIPQDQLLIVYGKVYIVLKDNKYNDTDGTTKTQTYIHFKDITSKKLITSCKKPDELDISTGYYYVVVLGKCHSNTYNEQTYYNLHVNYPFSESILLEELEDQ